MSTPATPLPEVSVIRPRITGDDGVGDGLGDGTGVGTGLGDGFGVGLTVGDGLGGGGGGGGETTLKDFALFSQK
jgi:hypothetical protein